MLSCSQLAEADYVCLKMQQPACRWELYITRELMDRLIHMEDDVLKRGVVSVT